jgi:hypothetical protein
MLAAGMPSLENHEGWGNRFVVLRIACIYYRSVSEKPHFSQKSREMGHPESHSLHKPQRVGQRPAGTD